jgi:hypothetical protein
MVLATGAPAAVKKMFSAASRNEGNHSQQRGEIMARVRGASATKEMRKSAGGGKFISLKDGDEVEGCFAGVLKHGLEGELAEPLGMEVVWIDGANGRYSIEYDPKVHSEDDMRVTFVWNFLVRGEAEDGSQDEMKIFQQGPQFFDQFIKHKDKKGYGYWFTISRTGSGQFDTKYSLDREDKIDDADIEDIKQLELLDLDKEATSTREDDRGDNNKEDKKSRRSSRRRRAADAARTTSDEDGSSRASSNGSLSDEQRQKLKAACMALPDPTKAQDALKKRLGIAKLGDIVSDQFDDAITFIANIAAGEGDEAADVDDPFFD